MPSLAFNTITSLGSHIYVVWTINHVDVVAGIYFLLSPQSAKQVTDLNQRLTATSEQLLACQLELETSLAARVYYQVESSSCVKHFVNNILDFIDICFADGRARRQVPTGFSNY